MSNEQMHRSIVSIEQAEEILENGFIELEDAIEYLKANDEGNAVLNKYSGMDIELLKKQRAIDIYTGRTKQNTGRGSFNRETKAANDYVKELFLKGEDLRPLLGGVTMSVEENVIEEANNMSITPENSEAVEKNKSWIEAAYENFEAEEDEVPAWRRHNADVLDRIKFVDEDGNESDSIRHKSEKTIWEIAKNEVLRERSFDFDFMKLKEDDKLKLLRADLSDSVARTAMGVVGIAPCVNRNIDGEIAAQELAKADAKLSIAALDKFLSDKGKEKAEVPQSAVVGAALKESEVMENFVGYIEKKQYSKNVVDSFKKDHKSFCEKMKSFWGNAWSSAKEYVANNRARLIVDTAATLATGVALASGVGYAAIGAYAVYAGLGSLGWPIEEKRRKTLRRAKQEGRDYSDYKFGLSFKALKKAWNDIKSDEKELERYKNRAYTGAVAGVLITAGLGVVGTGIINGVDVLAAKVGGTIIRSLGSVTSQVLNFKNTREDLKLEDNAENRAAYSSAKWGLGIGITVAALASAWGIYNMLHSDVNVGAKGGKALQEQAKDTAQKVTKKVVKVTKKIAENNQLEAPAPSVVVPTEWKADCGVGQDVWADVHGGPDSHGNIRVEKVTGILSRTNAGFDSWNAAQKAMYGDAAKELLVASDSKDTIQDIYQNVTNILAADPKAFGGMNAQQVVVAYVKLVEQTEIVMKGPKVNINGKMVSTLISRIDKDGLPMYHNEYVNGKLIDHNSNMKKLFLMIRCGKKVDISAEDIKAELGRINLKSGRGIGEAFNRGVTNNVMIGEQGCCNGVSIWRRGFNAVRKAFSKDATVKTTQVRELEKNDVNVKSTELVAVDADVRSVQVRELEQVDANANAVYTKENLVLGRGTSDRLDNDLTDRVAQGGKKVGSTIAYDGSMKKLDAGCWLNGNPKEGGR